jgi:aspartate/methionine/tyrosine aminotransferase
MERNALVKELSDLEDIEECEKQFYERMNYYPFNLSTWNPSDCFVQKCLLNKVKLAKFPFVNYIYSYELEDVFKNRVLRKFNVSKDQGHIFTNSGSSSVNLVATCLCKLGVKSVLIVSPCYYTVFHNFKQQNIQIIELHMKRESQGYRLPYEEMERHLNAIDAVWVTNPLYNTGKSYSDEALAFLKKIMDKGKYLVADECFCITGNELLRTFQNDRFIGIYDPLKQLLINGIKFSLIVFASRLSDLFFHWSDVVCGGLSYSSLQGMDIFLSDAFGTMSQNVAENSNHSYQIVSASVSEYKNIEIDQDISGHMMMVYIKKLHGDYLQNKADLKNLIMQTGVSIIPGKRFHFPNAYGFSFRLNLARDCREFRASLNTVLEYLNQKSNMHMFNR